MTKKLLFSLASAGCLAFAGVMTATSLSSPSATVFADQAITVLTSPKSGSTVGSLPESITLMFDGATSVEFNLSSEDAIVVTWNGADKSALFRLLEENDNSIVFDFGNRSTTDPISGTGVLTVTFPEGYYTINGSIPSPEVVYTLTVSENASAGVPFFDLWEAGYPEINKFVEEGENLSWMAMQLSEEVTLNTSCTETIDLYLDNSAKPLASIPATDLESAPAFVSVSGEMVDFYFSKTEEFNAEGSYKVAVPTGFFKDSDGNDIAASEAHFQIGVGTFDPADGIVDIDETGTFVNSKHQFYQIRLTPFTGLYLNEDERNDNGDITREGCSVPATLTNENGDILATFLTNNMALSRGVLNFRFPTPIETKGTYTLSLPEGFFVTTMGNNLVESPAIRATFNVISSSAAPEESYTLSPEAGYYQVFPTITITYDNVIDVKVPAGSTVGLSMTGSTDKVLEFDVTAEENVVTLTPKEDFNTFKTNMTVYTVTVPEGLYSLVYESGESYPNKELAIVDYKINPLPIATITPADGAYVKEFTTMEVLPHIALTGAPSSLKKVKVFALENGVRGTQVGNFQSFVTEDKGSIDSKITATFVATAGATLEDGEYEIEIPDGFYTAKIDGITAAVSFPKTILHYILGVPTAVKIFEAENTTVTVYNINGTRVLENAEPEALGTLSSGLYIVNGKKVVIR